MNDMPEYTIERKHKGITRASGLINEIAPFHRGRYKVIDDNNTICWCKNGLLHRKGGPARICKNGTETWLENGMIHRLDGPAHVSKIINLHEWWIYGEAIYSFDQYRRVGGCSSEMAVALKLKWGEIESWFTYR